MQQEDIEQGTRIGASAMRQEGVDSARPWTQ